MFDWNEDDKAYAVREEVPEELDDEALEAVDGCPTGAILEH
ncbi:ferredoxin [Desulfosoma caldarium]